MVVLLAQYYNSFMCKFARIFKTFVHSYIRISCLCCLVMRKSLSYVVYQCLSVSVRSVDVRKKM